MAAASFASGEALDEGTSGNSGEGVVSSCSEASGGWAGSAALVGRDAGPDCLGVERLGAGVGSPASVGTVGDADSGVGSGGDSGVGPLDACVGSTAGAGAVGDADSGVGTGVGSEVGFAD